MSNDVVKKNDVQNIDLKKVVDSFRSNKILDEGVFIYVPPVTVPGVFGGFRNKDDSWGRSTPKSWMKAGPAWIKSGGSVWKPEEELLDFGGIVTPDLLMELARNNVRIILGSVEESRWRIAVPRENLNQVRSILKDAKEVDFIKSVSMKK